jgi:phenylpropionate dioxygenase-like ring-hydroxylating dioxygenase large terminal subunit
MNLMNHPIFRRFWYPTLSIAELAAGPRPFTLLGEEMVLWLAAPGRPAATRDRCPHRSARLSVDSTVVDGNIRCNYHGWQFNHAGACKVIPQLPGDVPPDRKNCVKSYRCEERYGFAWVCLEQPLQDIPHIRHSDDPAFRQVFEYEEDWNANMLRVGENALDIAHISFVHRQTFGNEEKPAAPVQTLVPLEHGVNFTCTVPVANHELQQRNLQIDAGETVRTVDIRWMSPCTFVLHFTYPTGLIHEICGFATPIANDRIRRIQFVLRNDTEADAPAENVARFDCNVIAEDRRMLESCDPDYPLEISQEAHMRLDRPGLAMREYLAGLILQHDPNAQLLRAELERAREVAAA